MANQEIISERLKVRATDFWYRKAFDYSDKKAPQYTKLLKKIVKESHVQNSLTIYLAPLLAIFWRMNRTRDISVSKLMDWCNLDYSSYNSHRMRDLKSLEAELNYMKDKGYLGSWSINGQNILPSKCEKPFECILSLTPPEWLDKETKAIEERRDKLLPQSTIDRSSINKELIKKIMEKEGLTQNQLANSLGAKRQTINYIVTGVRGVSRKLATTIIERYSHHIN